MIIYRNRQKIILAFIAGILLIYWVRLVQLQIFKKEYKYFAEENVLQKKTVYPPRGLILDRHQKPLVTNKVVYDLMVIPSKVRLKDTLEFCKILDISMDYFQEQMTKAIHYSRYKPSLFLRNITLETGSQMLERMYDFKGFYFEKRTVRHYPLHTASHLVGYIGEVSEEIIKQSNHEYQPGDFIGISGLEKYYEKTLKGQNGVRFVLVNVFNVEQGSYLNGAEDREAVAGSHLITGVDASLQAYVEKLMINKAGSFVAIEPSTGEVLALVSNPDFYPGLLNTRKRSEYYQELITNPSKPLFNRAISAMYPPGSTFKIAMALTGLQEHAVSPQTTYQVNGGFYLPGLRIGDHVFGPVNLYTSIVKSSNAYYCYVFRNLMTSPKFSNIYESYNHWREYMLQFNFGEKTGIDLDHESPGILPSTARFDKMYGKNRWSYPHIISLAIGQAEISLTPLQLANFAALVANKGYYYKPHIVRAIQHPSGVIEYIPITKKYTDIDSHYYSLVSEAMQDVLLKGTAIRYGPYFKKLKICGKTGTSQNPHGEDHSVFIAFAPRYQPRIAVAAVIENAGQGAHWAAPICMLAIEKYLTGKISQETEFIEKIMLQGNFLNPSDSTHVQTTLLKNE